MSDMGHGKFIVKKHLNMSKIRERGKKQGTGWMCFFSAANRCRYFMLLCQKCSFKTQRLQVQVDIGSE